MNNDTRIQPSRKRCPSCEKVGFVYRSHSRNVFEKVIKSSRIFSVYRCHNCGWRGIRIKRTKTKKFFTKKMILVYVLFLIFVYFFVSYFLTRYFELTHY